jgi:hypothetical protein
MWCSYPVICLGSLRKSTECLNEDRQSSSWDPPPVQAFSGASWALLARWEAPSHWRAPGSRWTMREGGDTSMVGWRPASWDSETHVQCCETCFAPNTSEPSAGGDSKHVHSTTELNENENCISKQCYSSRRRDVVTLFSPLFLSQPFCFLTLHASNTMLWRQLAIICK